MKNLLALLTLMNVTCPADEPTATNFWFFQVAKSPGSEITLRWSPVRCARAYAIERTGFCWVRLRERTQYWNESGWNFQLLPYRVTIEHLDTDQEGHLIFRDTSAKAGASYRYRVQALTECGGIPVGPWSPQLGCGFMFPWP